ncbi:uncharacterized protein J3R85_014321 [Psidium guajava]|nr:uncharacterized protein J3R85_014321 [Psidium guajava]
MTQSTVEEKVNEPGSSMRRSSDALPVIPRRSQPFDDALTYKNSKPNEEKKRVRRSGFVVVKQERNRT